jgi:acyl carrier protein
MAQKLVTEEKVIEVVKQAVVETLNSDESIIKPDSSLIKDLGAESLDFLDINYRIEQAFGIKMARHFILEHIEEMFGEGVAVDDDNLIMDILNSLPEECPSCSKSTWKSDDGIRITCGSCGEPATFTNGDDLIKEWLTMVQAEQNIF